MMAEDYQAESESFSAEHEYIAYTVDIYLDGKRKHWEEYYLDDFKIKTDEAVIDEAEYGLNMADFDTATITKSHVKDGITSKSEIIKTINYEAESFESDTLSAKEYVKLAKNIDNPYERDDWNDLYVEGYIDCLVDNELTDDFFDAESFEAEGGVKMADGKTDYNICTDKNLHHLANDPAFWKGLKEGDVVCGREVMHTAQRMTCCGWPLLHDLMSDEGTNWMVCRCVDCGMCGKMMGADDPIFYDDGADMDFCSKKCKDKSWEENASFEADMTVGDGFKLGVGAVLGFTAIGAAFGLLGNVIGNLIGTKEE